MSAEELKAKAVDYLGNLHDWDTFTPSSLQRELKCGYAQTMNIIEELKTEGRVKLCQWTYQRAKPVADQHGIRDAGPSAFGGRKTRRE